MSRRTIPAACLVPLVCLGAWSLQVSPAGGPEPDHRLRGITAAHNAARARAEPRPSPPLGALVWDDRLASLAQAWADTCPSGHNPSRGAVGENLAFTSGASWTVERIVALWTEEAASYDWRRHRCSGGILACGHYLQVVTRSTTKVGCGVRMDCDGHAIWVCNYAAPWDADRRPY